MGAKSNCWIIMIQNRGFLQLAAFLRHLAPSKTNVVTGRHSSDLDLLQGHSFIVLKLLLSIKPGTSHTYGVSKLRKRFSSADCILNSPIKYSLFNIKGVTDWKCGSVCLGQRADTFSHCLLFQRIVVLEHLLSASFLWSVMGLTSIN